MKKTVAIPKNLIFGTENYTPLCVYDYIGQNANYDTFVGFDFGDGVCTVYKAHIESIVVTENGAEKIMKQWVIKKIEVKDISVPDGVPTAMVYKDKKIIIGKNARNHDNIYHQFKFSPDKWDKNYNGRSIKKLIMGFLKSLWKEVRETDPTLSENSEKTLIVVGYPGGSDWTQEENINIYRNLLRRIFDGYGVDVMPEPFAAVFGAIFESVEKKNPLCMTDGIFIDESGSSTDDVCYMIPGKKPFTDSVNCAGRDIDKRMFYYLVAVNEEKLGLERVLFEPDSVSRAIWELKGFKEAYCEDPSSFDNASLANIKSINFVQFVSGVKTRKKIEFRLNKALIDNAVNLEITKNTSMGPVTKTWLSETKCFLERNKSVMSECKKLIIAGGTSKVPQFEETVRNVFASEIAENEDFIHKSDNPTQLVAKGLAYKKLFEKKILQLRKNFDNVCGFVTGKGYNSLLERFSEEIAKIKVKELECFCKEFLETPAANRKNYTGQSFNSEITSRILKTDTESLIRPFRKIFFEEFENVQEELKNGMSPILNTAFGLKTDDVKVVNVADMKSDLHTLNDEGEKILKDTVMTGIRDLDSSEWMFSKFMEKAGYWFNYIDDVFCMRKLSETGNKSGYEQKVKRTKKSVLGTFFAHAYNFEDLFSAYMAVQYEIYLGKALLLIYE